MNFPFYLILVNFNVKSHMWIVAVILDSIGTEEGSGRIKQ